jgi:endoglycosylceramidase
MRRVLLAILALTLGAAVLSSCGSTAPAEVQQYSPTRAPGLERLSSLEPHTYLSGPLLSPGGPFMKDRFGRTILLHGVNAVYKFAPYTLTVTPGQPNSLAAADAVRISSDGFNVVRLGIIWAGIEPGSGGPNQPKVCTPGAPGDPGMWNQKVADAYLSQVQRVVDELGQRHIYSLLDMHQDVWSSVFSGEGAPPWAVCTSGNPVVVYPGRWSDNYANPAVDASFSNFFDNAVVGGLQNEYQRSWRAVAEHFKSNPWVVGYDPINEPLGLRSKAGFRHRDYSTGLSCLYGGSDGETVEIGSTKAIVCPPGVPKQGLVELLLQADHTHLVFPEVDNATNHGKTLFVTSSKDLSRVVYNFHDYCPQRSGATGNPDNLQHCSDAELLQLIRQEQLRPLYASHFQPDGPAIMMTEFGATNDPALASRLALDASTVSLSWTWWSWRYYDDPTGSSAEALIGPSNTYSPVINSLTQTHVVAIAGSLLSSQFDEQTGNFTLVYAADTAIKAPTVVYVSPGAYPVGYCAYVRGAAIRSPPGAEYLTLDSQVNGSTVVLRLEPGRCVASL